MKKITLLLLLLVSITLQAQISSGTITFTAGYTGQIDIDETNVTLTLVGNEDNYLAVGFDGNGMTAGGDIVSFDSTGFNDRVFQGIGIVPLLDTQDWTLVSNEVEGSTRTLVATRPLVGTDTNDFEFSPNQESLNLVWSRGSSLNFQNHGSQNRGSTFISFTLGVNGNVDAKMVSLYPVPAKDFVTVSLQNIATENTNLSIYSITGEKVYSTTVDHKSMIVNTSDFANGVYVLKVENPSGVLTTQFIKR